LREKPRKAGYLHYKGFPTQSKWFEIFSSSLLQNSMLPPA
jgi:hypothetical protein